MFEKRTTYQIVTLQSTDRSQHVFVMLLIVIL